MKDPEKTKEQLVKELDHYFDKHYKLKYNLG